MLLEKICEELGVEVGEKWIGNDGYKYRISKNGKIFAYDKRGFYTGSCGFGRWESVFNGELKPAWRPKEGEFYYVPFTNSIKDTEMWDYEKWGIDEQYDKTMLKKGLVFRTKEEAIAASNKMIEILREEQ